VRRARWEADNEIASQESGTPLRLAWRVDELVGTKNRLDLAHSLRSLVRDADARYLPSASPVNRPSVREHSEDILAVAGRLADLERSIAARGVVLADRLLIDSSGPLYDRDLADELPIYLSTTLAALERR
jgi:hypothetical protein